MAPPIPGLPDETEILLGRLQSLIFPEFIAHDAPLLRCVEIFNWRSRELDPTGVGFDLVIDPEALKVPLAASGLLKSSWRNIPASELVKHMAGAFGLGCSLVGSPARLVIYQSESAIISVNHS